MSVALFCTIWIGIERDIVGFITNHISNVMVVGVTVVTLSAITYAYFYFENTTVLTKKLKIVEIYFLIILSFILCFVIGKYVEGTARPLLFFPLMAAMILRRRDSVFITTVYTIIVFIFDRYLNSTGSTGVLSVGGISQIESISSLLTLFCGGVMGILLLRKVKTRLSCVMVALLLLIPVIPINVVMQIPSLEVVTVRAAFKIAGSAAMDSHISILLIITIHVSYTHLTLTTKSIV